MLGDQAAGRKDGIEVDAAIAVVRRAYRQDHDVGLRHGLRHRGGEVQAAALVVADDDILEIGLEDRHDAALQVRNLGGILVDAPGLESQLGKASPRNKAYVPGTYDSYPHCLLHFPCKIGTDSYRERVVQDS